LEKFKHSSGVFRIEVAGRLVGEKKSGAMDQSAGDGGALHFAAAHLMRESLRPRAESDEFEHFGGAGAGLAGAVAAQEQGKLDVLHRSHGREEIEKLEDDAEVFAPVGRELCFAGVVQREAVDGDFSGARLVESAEKIEQRAFAAAARSGYRAERMRRDLQRDVVQGVHFAGWRGINAGDMAQTDHSDEEIFRSARLAQDNFRVVAEGADWIVVDKPAGLLTHPTRPDGAPTLWDGLRQLLAYELANRGQLSIITRLDRETSGLVLLALTRERARDFGLAMQRGAIGKEYLAIVRGWPEWEKTTVDAPIVRQGEVRDSPVWLKRCVDQRGAPAKTDFTVERRFERNGEKFALLRAKPRTGRTHQIRLHAAHIGHPLVGDKIYGGREGAAYLEFIETGWTPKLEEELLLPRHALHAVVLEFDDRNGRQHIEGELAADLRKFSAES
jgi:23S rRNA pseudouridine1911/1915/1917 synthase